MARYSLIPPYSFTLLAFICAVIVSQSATSLANAKDCAPKSASGACLTLSGEYHIRLPASDQRLHKLPIALLLHDAGGDGTELLDNTRLMDALLGRGYAVVVPVAEQRKYVRSTTKGLSGTAQISSGNFKHSKSKRRYTLIDLENTLRLLKQGQDRGWYFYTTDIHTEAQANLAAGPVETRPLGRDEPEFLRQVIRHASQTYWLSADKTVVAGVGHGAALTWQLACLERDFGLIYAPVNGAHWGAEPPNCVTTKGKVLHTHERQSTFWPFDGTKQTRRKFGQVAVKETLSAYARAKGCSFQPSPATPSKTVGIVMRTWTGCNFGSALELALLDEPFDFPGWWLDHVFGSPKNGGSSKISGQPEEKALGTPRFLKPKYN